MKIVHLVNVVHFGVLYTRSAGVRRWALTSISTDIEHQIYSR